MIGDYDWQPATLGVSFDLWGKLRKISLVNLRTGYKLLVLFRGHSALNAGGSKPLIYDFSLH